MNTTTPAQAKATASFKKKPKICNILILGNEGVPFSTLAASLFSERIISAGALTRRGPARALLTWSPDAGIKPPPKCTLCDKGGRICTVAHVLRTSNGMAGLQKPGALPTRCMVVDFKAESCRSRLQR